MNYSNYSLNFDAPIVEIMSAAIAQGIIDIPSSMPLVEEIVYSHAKVTDVDTTCQDAKVLVSATVNFVVVYVDRDQVKHSLEAKTAFEHSMSYPAIEEGMRCNVTATCGSEECRVTTSTSIAAQCIVEIGGWAYQKQSVQVAQSKDTSEQIQTMNTDITWVSSVIFAHADNTLRQDIRIAENKPSIISLLDNSADYIIENAYVSSGKVNITGHVNVEIIYSHNTGVDKAQAKLPCEILIEDADIVAAKTICTDITVKYLDIKIYEDEDGKRKILSIEAPIHAKISQEVNSKTSVVLDAYGICSDLDLSYLDLELPTNTEYINKPNCQVSTPISLGEDIVGSELHSIGHITVETLVAEGKKLTITGLLKLRVWSKEGIYSDCESLYTMDVITDRALESTTLSCIPTLRRSSVYQNNNNEWIANAEIDVAISAMSRQSMRVVNEIVENEMSDCDKYTLMLAIPSREDTLWSLAKRCRVSPDDILELNPTLSSEVVPGSPVIIYKKA